MLTTTKKIKWLLALVLIFGGFTVYKLFEGLTHNPSYREYEWIFKIISEFGLFGSVVVSVGYFHHWFIAAEEHKESQISLRETLAQYVDSILLNSIKRGFSGITNKEFDLSQILQGLKPGDYVYWLITFDPRFKNKTRELENGIKKGVHFRMLILKADSRIGELRAMETTGFNAHEFNEYSKLFKVSLEDVIARIDDSCKGSIGVFVYDGLPCIPLFVVLRSEAGKMEIYHSFYLTEPVSKMPYLHWETDLKLEDQTSFESEHWEMAELFLDYFKKRWSMEKARLYDTSGKECADSGDFLHAPASARKRCTELFSDTKPR